MTILHKRMFLTDIQFDLYWRKSIISSTIWTESPWRLAGLLFLFRKFLWFVLIFKLSLLAIEKRRNYHHNPLVHCLLQETYLSSSNLAPIYWNKKGMHCTYLLQMRICWQAAKIEILGPRLFSNVTGTKKWRINGEGLVKGWYDSILLTKFCPLYRDSLPSVKSICHSRLNKM